MLISTLLCVYVYILQIISRLVIQSITDTRCLLEFYHGVPQRRMVETVVTYE